MSPQKSKLCECIYYVPIYDILSIQRPHTPTDIIRISQKDKWAFRQLKLTYLPLGPTDRQQWTVSSQQSAVNWPKHTMAAKIIIMKATKVAETTMVLCFISYLWVLYGRRSPYVILAHKSTSCYLWHKFIRTCHGAAQATKNRP